MFIIELFRLKNNKRYQMKMLSRALYYQVEYDSYELTAQLEHILAKEEEMSSIILYQILQSDKIDTNA